MYEYGSWIGVGLLISAHAMISFGIHKQKASYISGAGALICALSAIGMSIYSVAALNVAWMLISFFGASISERSTSSSIGKMFLVASLSGLVVWNVFGVEYAAWLGTLLYVGAWFLFSSGSITRSQYVGSCILVALWLVPVLWTKGAHAFAVNETIGACMGLLGLARLHFAEKSVTRT